MNALIQQIVGEARFDGDPEDIQMVQPPPAPGHQNALTAVLGGPPHATSGTEESREVEIGKSSSRSALKYKIGRKSAIHTPYGCMSLRVN